VVKETFCKKKHFERKKRVVFSYLKKKTCCFFLLKEKNVRDKSPLAQRDNVAPFFFFKEYQ